MTVNRVNKVKILLYLTVGGVVFYGVCPYWLKASRISNKILFTGLKALNIYHVLVWLPLHYSIKTSVTWLDKRDVICVHSASLFDVKLNVEGIKVFLKHHQRYCNTLLTSFLLVNAIVVDRQLPLLQDNSQFYAVEDNSQFYAVKLQLALWVVNSNCLLLWRLVWFGACEYFSNCSIFGSWLQGFYWP